MSISDIYKKKKKKTFSFITEKTANILLLFFKPMGLRVFITKKHIFGGVSLTKYFQEGFKRGYD